MADRVRHAKKIDTVHWTLFSWVTTGFAAGTVGINLLSAQHLPETLLRLRGRWGAHISSAVAPGLLASISVGIIQVPEGTGTTVLWSPQTDGDAPWIWWDQVFIGHEEAVVDAIGVQSIAGQQVVIDSKAMRKLRNTELQLVAENATINSAVSVDLYGGGRALAGS